ncbi:MAG: hypothetical protein WKF91_23590, partial [Segetibacter sp.]
VFTNTGNGWKVWPETVANVNVSYYKLPADVRWGYTTVNNRPVYNPATSVDPVWDNVSTEEILAKSCTYLGISFEKQSMVQFGEASKMQGV